MGDALIKSGNSSSTYSQYFDIFYEYVTSPLTQASFAGYFGKHGLMGAGGIFRKYPAIFSQGTYCVFRITLIYR